jgi:hypothetical protein
MAVLKRGINLERTIMRSLFKEYIPKSHWTKPFNDYGSKEEAALMKALSIDPSKFSEDNITYEEEEVIMDGVPASLPPTTTEAAS